MGASDMNSMNDSGTVAPFAAGCPFCERRGVEIILTQTPHFYVLADHAPLVAGHTLIIPHAHYACYGDVPAVLEAEFLALKRRMRRFLTAAYGVPSFFEHGVFRQTVYHAHLHALPFGPVGDFDVAALAATQGGAPVHRLADVRAWYTKRGHYTYLEIPIPAVQSVDRATRGQQDFGDAALFPPVMRSYRSALGMLQEQTATIGQWRPPAERYAERAPLLAELAAKWQAFAASENV
ncbi:MAG: HIT family protein [Ktedonobacterales bacterium]